MISVRQPPEHIYTIKYSTSDVYPTGRFTISEPQYQEIVEFFVVQERRGTDFEAPKL